jgi:hypothetical protein
LDHKTHHWNLWERLKSHYFEAPTYLPAYRLPDRPEPRREANLLDVLGDFEAGNVDLEIPQFKESPNPANLNA